jgi:hypothetical protein
LARQTVLPRSLFVFIVCGLLAAVLAAHQPASAPPADVAFRTAALPIERRVDAILAEPRREAGLSADEHRSASPRHGDRGRTSAGAGDEVAQLYVEQVGAKTPRPSKALKGFQRVSLKPGESRTIQLPLTADVLAAWDAGTHTWKLEPGPVKISIGSSSALIRSSVTLTVE